MRVFTTESVDSHRRVDFWSSLSSNNITPMLISADRRAPFEGRLWVDQVGPIGLARAYSSSVVIKRTGARFSSDARNFVLTVSEGASYTAVAKGREQLVHGGDLRLSDTSEVMEVEHSGCTAIVLCIKARILKEYLPMADDLVGQIVRGDRGAGLHASTMIRSLPAGMRHGFVDSATDHLTAALLHSIAAAYSQTYSLTDTAPVTAGSRRVVIKRFVDASLSDADLTVQKKLRRRSTSATVTCACCSSRTENPWRHTYSVGGSMNRRGSCAIRAATLEPSRTLPSPGASIR